MTPASQQFPQEASCGTQAASQQARPRCLHCLDDGSVCESHPEYPWDVTVEGHPADCGGAGMPCPACCSPIPEDGTHSIAEAFVPDWQRVQR